MAKKFNSYREESKKNWGIELPEEDKINRAQITTGAILRIADATESMAKRHTELIADKEWYKRKYTNAEEEIERLRKSNASYRGQITKLKKKLNTVHGD